MGCIASKRASSDPPASDDDDHPGENRVKRSANVQRNVYRNHKEPALQPVKALEKRREDETPERDGDEREKGDGGGGGKKLKSSKSKGSGSNFSLSLRFGTVKNQVGAEQSAAGWPGWLTAVAGEAIHGWIPLRADSFEKLEKIGQGTYSSVFRARENATGKIVALKKVRFDNLHPESVRFMAREITILRRLDHPNIMKLHGLITSRLSCSIYLVFDYMEHDLAGLISCPEIMFTESQIKCFMQQLLYGLDYCHRRGVMHRDVKSSNILLNNDGVLKLADFGLANFISTRYKQPLTSRVVTLWYRPPELLLGSTNYGAYVDLWSVGCVFAELLIGKPILKGKTEVEQLHKIFKLCGSPPEEFWKKSKLPHATMFKPQAPYESSLRERCKGLPEPAVNLLETLLSIEPQNRGTAADALMAEYFTTMPYACDPASLPKYPPNKEIDAKSRDEAQRRKTGRVQDSSSSRVPRRHKGLPEPSSVSMLGRPEEPQMNRKYARRNGTNTLISQLKKGVENERFPMDMKSDVSQVTNASQGDTIFGGSSLPSSGFTWAKRKTEDASSQAIKKVESKEAPSHQEDESDEEQ
ncbi:Protein IMPAIRED IN BABA-INDUCED STERILITY 1 [Dionaea muscipula]